MNERTDEFFIMELDLIYHPETISISMAEKTMKTKLKRITWYRSIWGADGNERPKGLARKRGEPLQQADVFFGLCMFEIRGGGAKFP